MSQSQEKSLNLNKNLLNAPKTKFLDSPLTKVDSVCFQLAKLNINKITLLAQREEACISNEDKNSNRRVLFKKPKIYIDLSNPTNAASEVIDQHESTNHVRFWLKKNNPSKIVKKIYPML